MEPVNLNDLYKFLFVIQLTVNILGYAEQN